MRKPRQMTVRDQWGDSVKASLANGNRVRLAVAYCADLTPKKTHRLAKRLEEMAAWLEEQK